MMFWILMSQVLLAATLLQAHLPGVAVFGGARWPVLGCVVLYYALNHRPRAGLVAGLAAGVLLDMLSRVPVGYSIFVFCTTAMIAGRYRRLVLTEAAVTATFFGALSGLLYGSLLVVFLAHGRLAGSPPLLVAARLLGGGVLGGATAPLVFVVLTRLHRALDLEDKEEQSRVNA